MRNTSSLEIALLDEYHAVVAEESRLRVQLAEARVLAEEVSKAFSVASKKEIALRHTLDAYGIDVTNEEAQVA